MTITHVAGRCPACSCQTLVVGNGSRVTCTRVGCSNPLAADELLHGNAPAAGSTAVEFAAARGGHVPDEPPGYSDHVSLPARRRCLSGTVAQRSHSEVSRGD